MACFLNQTPRFDGYVVRCVSKCKHHRDTCSEENGLHLQIPITDVHLIVNTIRRIYVSCWSPFLLEGIYIRVVSGKWVLEWIHPTSHPIHGKACKWLVFLIRPLDLTGMWFGGDQSANIIETRVQKRMGCVFEYQ